MSFGYDKQGRVFLGDTKTLVAYLYDDTDTLVPLAEISAVRFTVLAPGGDPSAPTIAAATGQVIADGTGQYLVAGSFTTIPGEWKAYATFTFNVGGGVETKSVPTSFEVIDPFVRAAATPADGAVDAAWTKLEDCFDSEQGGPWLRDMSMSNFSRDKIKDFIPDVLLEINAVMPQTEYTVDGFPFEVDDGKAIFGWGLLLATIRHLMRSYTEQPDESTSPVPHMDRTKYQQAWSVIYQIEKERYDELLRLFKVRSYSSSGAALLVGSKAGRLLPAPMRTRNVGRGYY